ncbi:hypothetical protein ABPG75_011703 [Micractinium tetrahymenae]
MLGPVGSLGSLALAALGARVAAVGLGPSLNAMCSSGRPGLAALPSLAAAASSCAWRGLAGGSSNCGSSSAGSSSELLPHSRGVHRMTSSSPAEPQLRLQAWLRQEHGLSDAEAALRSRQLLQAFGGGDWAAVASLPAAFAWCRSQPLSNGGRLSGGEVAALLAGMAARRSGSVAHFAITAQRNWRLIDRYIATYVLDQLGAGRPVHHACLADLVRSGAPAAEAAAAALAAPPNHVAAFLAAAGERLSPAQIGALLLKVPQPGS